MLDAREQTTDRHRVHRLRVRDVERLTAEAVAVTFDVPPELRDTFTFAAGQHVAVERLEEGAHVRRSYSICSPEGGTLRIGVKRLDGGRFSTYACTDLVVGEHLDVLPPSGRFTLPDAEGRPRHIVAVVAGSGITPALSLLATVLAGEPESRCTLLYGNRSASTIMFLEELEDLKNRFCERFMMINVLSREPGGAELVEGRIDATKITRLLGDVIPVADVDGWYLCGPRSMVDEVRESLLAAGVAPGSVHRELFHVDELPAQMTSRSGAQSAAVILATLDGRTTELALHGHEPSILDALLKMRPDAPYACKGGVCGTCRCRLIEGEVEMTSSYALEDDEIASGVRLACQSHARSDRVVLDFDAV